MTACQCDRCRSACERIPGLFTPDEAEHAIEAGHADRMMAVAYHDERDGDYLALAPRSVPHGKPELTHIGPHLRLDTAAAKGRCTYFTKDRKCELHGTGFKPGECRTTRLCAYPDGLGHNVRIRREWASRF